MKTNHRRSNPPLFQRDTQEQTERNFRPSGGPNYSLMGYQGHSGNKNGPQKNGP